jgi:hypothetical protein
VGHQRAQRALQASLSLEGIKNQSNPSLGLLVWVELAIPIRTSPKANGWVIQQGPALGLVPDALPQAALKPVPFRFAQHVTVPQLETIVVVRRIIEAIGIGL